MEGAGAEASRILLGRFGAFSLSLPIPADASGAYRPNPQATTKLAPAPPLLKGYPQSSIPRDRARRWEELKVDQGCC